IKKVWAVNWLLFPGYVLFSAVTVFLADSNVSYSSEGGSSSFSFSLGIWGMLTWAYVVILCVAFIKAHKRRRNLNQTIRRGDQFCEFGDHAFKCGHEGKMTVECVYDALEIRSKASKWQIALDTTVLTVDKNLFEEDEIQWIEKKINPPFD
ncbi:MAG: hypothetical protein R3336_05590, partial [Phycisphaeraceae bacterium]|nr:hypothetical protein [Phycisphaeraceae bacterium]